MSKAVIHLLNESIMMLDWNNQLVLTMWFMMVQRSVEKEKAGGSIDERGVVGVREVGRTSVRLKEIINRVNLGILCNCLEQMR